MSAVCSSEECAKRAVDESRGRWQAARREELASRKQRATAAQAAAEGARAGAARGASSAASRNGGVAGSGAGGGKGKGGKK
eukprot:2242772-Rhodomonas_salina.2